MAGTNGATALSPEATVNSSRLHGTVPPKYVLVEETPWHFAVALMMAAGSVTQKEVADAFGVSVPTIRNLIRQPWFQERVTNLMREHGGRDIMELFKAESFNCLVTLVELRDNDKVAPAVRAATCRDILDRALGKPLQRVETTGTPTSDDPVGEVKRLEEENNRMKAL